MTEKTTDHEEIREIAEEIRAQTGRNFSPEQMQQEFRVNDLDVGLEDLMAALEFDQ